MEIFLETARLTLRRFTPRDIELLVNLDADPEVMRYLSGGTPTPRETIARRVLPGFVGSYAKFGGLGYWVALARGSQEFLGWFALHPVEGRKDELELGYRLRRDAWGRGLATEGARALVEEGFRRGAAAIFAQTYEENVASRRVMEKLGMTFIREFRVSADVLSESTFDPADGALFPGNDVEYSITAEAWASGR